MKPKPAILDAPDSEDLIREAEWAEDKSPDTEVGFWLQQLTVAVYRVGAGLSASLDWVAKELQQGLLVRKP
jgi:hypothetical protein